MPISLVGKPNKALLLNKSDTSLSKNVIHRAPLSVVSMGVVTQNLIKQK